MKLTRGKRIALEVLGPPALGASVWLVVIFVSQLFEPAGKDLIRFLRELPGAALFLLVAAYVFAGLQSVFYAVIMEWNFTAGLARVAGSRSHCHRSLACARAVSSRWCSRPAGKQLGSPGCCWADSACWSVWPWAC